MTLGPLMIDVEGIELTADERELLKHPLAGAVILFARNFASVEQLEQLVAGIHALRTPSLLVAVDQEGGRVQRFREGFTVLPSMRTIGYAYDVDHLAGRQLARQCGWMMAAELLALGVDLSFAPVVDLDYGVSTAIGDRSFHRDPRAVGDLAVAFAGGMRQAGMVATAKHFPGHGAVAADSHVAAPVDRRSLADLDDDIYPYRRLIDNGLTSIMASHVTFPEVDWRPAGFSSRWLQDELRARLGFGGAIFTDDLSMAAAEAVGPLPERARAALEAGCDMLTLCNNRQGVLQVIDSLHGRVDPVSQVRRARLRGAPVLSWGALKASADWQVGEQAIRSCMDRPDLQLDA